MATIEFRTGSGNLAVFRAWLDDSSGIFYGGGTNPLGGTSNAKIYIYKGTVPTTIESITDISTRSSDLLLTFTPSSIPTAGSEVTIGGVRYYRMATGALPAISGSGGVAASQSGTASWFLWVASISTTANPNNTNAIMGNVGTFGSGSDLEIASTNIVSGTIYGISPIYFMLPVVWTV